jgi:fumarate reductase subunit D
MRTREAVRIYLVLASLAPAGGLAMLGMWILAVDFSVLAWQAVGLRSIAAQLRVSPERLWFLVAIGSFALFGIGMLAAWEAMSRLSRAAREGRIGPAGRRLGQAVFYGLILLFGVLLVRLLEPWILFLVRGDGGFCFPCV